MSTLSLLTPPDDAEARMRRALHIDGPGAGNAAPEHGHRARPARHYAQDGDVPVVRLPARKDHSTAAVALAKAEEALQEERAAREKVEAALKQAQATIQTLQTKIAHAELAHTEELATQRQILEAALAAKTEAPPARPERTRHAPAVQIQAAQTQELPDAAHAVEHAPAPKAADPAEEPEPVEWWVSGWRERLRS